MKINNTIELINARTYHRKWRVTSRSPKQTHAFKKTDYDYIYIYEITAMLCLYGLYKQ